MAAIDTVKANIFSTPMPDMPPKLREIWQVAYMFRRKYSSPDGKDPEAYFSAAYSDAQYIADIYGRNDTVISILGEVYLDIARQWKVVQAKQQEN